MTRDRARVSRTSNLDVEAVTMTRCGKDSHSRQVQTAQSTTAAAAAQSPAERSNDKYTVSATSNSQWLDSYDDMIYAHSIESKCIYVQRAKMVIEIAALK